jgi:hypothetical protein
MRKLTLILTVLASLAMSAVPDSANDTKKPDRLSAQIDSTKDPVVVSTKAAYEALADGTLYKWTDGQIYTKRRWFGAGGIRKVATPHTEEERAKIQPGFGFIWTDDKLYIIAAPGTEKDNCQDAKHLFEKASLEEASAP